MSEQWVPSQRARLAAGQPISGLMHRALAQPDLISLAAGFVDQTSLPVEFTALAAEWLLGEGNRACRALQYGTTPGFAPLRELLLARAKAADRGQGGSDKWHPSQVVITAGSNQLLHLAAEVLLDPGDLVLCAAPSYFVFLGTVRNVAAETIGIATDEQGLIPEAVEEELRRLEIAGELRRVKAIYVVSYFDNPCSVTLPNGHRAMIVDIAKRWSKVGKIHIIEDAAYRELRYEGDDVRSLASFDERGDTVLFTGTFSKSFAPGIRVGWGILPEHLVDPICNIKSNIDFGSPNFNQHLMAHLLNGDRYDQHVAKLRAIYVEKRDAMLSAADKFLSEIPGVQWICPRGGLYVWLSLPGHLNAGPDGPLFDLAVKEGVLYVPGQYCFPATGPTMGRHTIRLSFGVQNSENLRKGIRLLSNAIRKVI